MKKILVGLLCSAFLTSCAPAVQSAPVQPQVGTEQVVGLSLELEHKVYDPSLTSRQLLHVQLIRDADKLDNCRVKLEEPVKVLLGCTAEEVGRQDISPEVWEECLAHTSVHLEKRKTKMDYWVSYVAYFFDIAYKETMDIIREERYVERVIGRIPYENPETERKMRELRGMVEEYFEEK